MKNVRAVEMEELYGSPSPVSTKANGGRAGGNGCCVGNEGKASLSLPAITPSSSLTQRTGGAWGFA